VKKLISCLIITVLFVFTGCIDHTTVVMVNKDGSGTVTEATYLGLAMQQMMQMAAAMGGEQNASGGLIMSEEEMKEKAATMGEGVTFVSSKELKKQDGSTGVKVVYSFTDINKLKLSPDPDAADKGQGMMGANQPAPEKSDPITFEFKGGGSPSLVINLPQEDKTTAGEPTPTEETPVPPSAQEIAMMKQMFTGMRFKIAVGVEGAIKKTNASYVSKDAENNDRYVTLFDVDMDKLMEDEGAFNKLISMGEMAS